MIDSHPDQDNLLSPSIAGIYHSTVTITAETHLERLDHMINSSLPARTEYRDQCGCITTGTVASLNSRGLVGIVGAPKWKDEELELLARDGSPAQALQSAYMRYGNDCLDYIEGPFACMVMDVEKDLILAATDRLGIYSLFYAETSDGVLLGSSASSLYHHKEVGKEIREEGIFDYVYFHMVPSPVSIYRNIKKLPAGHKLQYSKGNLDVTCYWVPTFHEKTNQGYSQLSHQLRSLLKESVERATDDYQHSGCFLSGGLDSSSVTGYFSELNEYSSRAFCIGFSAEGYDEVAYARLTAKHFGVDLHEYYVTPEDVVNALPIIATSYDEPFGNSSALPAYFCAQLAKSEGVKRLLAGDGGDELFAGNERYAKQSIFEAYGYLPKPVRKFVLEPFIRGLPSSIKFVNKAKSYIDQANTHLPDRLQSYNFLHRHSPKEIFSDDFLSSVDTSSPLVLQRNTYCRPEHASILNRMLYFDWQYTLADNDIRKVSHMCALAGVEVAYPMLDEKLLNFSTTIPSKLKLKGNNLRHFYKRALSGWLPDETIQKRKQGFGLPFGIWMQSHRPLQEMAYENLLQLKSTKYFRDSFIDRAIELHRKGHAAYYGELIWILMVLQLWMSKHTQ